MEAGPDSYCWCKDCTTYQEYHNTKWKYDEALRINTGQYSFNDLVELKNAADLEKIKADQVNAKQANWFTKAEESWQHHPTFVSDDTWNISEPSWNIQEPLFNSLGLEPGEIEQKIKYTDGNNWVSYPKILHKEASRINNDERETKYLQTLPGSTKYFKAVLQPWKTQREEDFKKYCVHCQALIDDCRLNKYKAYSERKKHNKRNKKFYKPYEKLRT